MALSIALIAHDRKKNDIVAFAKKHTSLLSRYRLIATGNTGQRIQDGTNLKVESKLSGALGGDAQVAAEVVGGEVAAVIFLIDPLYAQQPEPDIGVLLRLCEVHNVPLATNLATAEAIATQLAAVPIAHLIFNPVSGQGNPDQALSTIRGLLTPALQLYVHQTTPEVDAGELAKRAIASQPDLLLASGGDGTVSAVAEALINTGIPLGVIPRGTANAFAVALGIPTNLQGACSTILAGTTKIVDAARCNGLSMVLLAGIGFEAEMVERANREAKDRFGALAYIMAGVQQLREQQMFTAHIEAEGRSGELQAAAITVANAAPPTSVLAQGFGACIVDDGLLEVTIGAPNTKLQAFNAALQMFGAALTGTPLNREDIICIRTSKLKIDTDPPQKVVVDGEIIGTTPVEIECLPKSLTVYVPPAIAEAQATTAEQ